VYGLQTLEYPGIGGNIAQTGSAVLKLSAGDAVSLMNSMFTGVGGSYTIFANRLQVAKLFFR